MCYLHFTLRTSSAKKTQLEGIMQHSVHWWARCNKVTRVFCTECPCDISVAHRGQSDKPQTSKSSKRSLPNSVAEDNKSFLIPGPLCCSRGEHYKTSNNTFGKRKKRRRKGPGSQQSAAEALSAVKKTVRSVAPSLGSKKGVRKLNSERRKCHLVLRS